MFVGQEISHICPKRLQRLELLSISYCINIDINTVFIRM